MPNVRRCTTWQSRVCVAALAMQLLGACQPLPQQESARGRLGEGDQQGAEARPHAPFHYLDNGDLEELARLIPAPVDSESLPAREMEERLTGLMQTQASRAAAASAGSVASDDLWRFSRAIGPAFTASNCPHIAEIMAKAQADADVVKNELKTCFARPRPGVKSNTDFNGNPEQWSYPSGSATRAALRARLLTAIAPEHEEALLREAWFVAHGRLIVGAHFASDVVAGFALGQAIGDRMLESQVMQADLETARKEWKSVAMQPAP